MKEIEVKAYLKDPTPVIEKLHKLGCTFSEPIRQVDTVYTKITGTLEEYLSNDHFLRIREKSDGRFIFTAKKPITLAVLSKIEYETEIKDPVKFEQALFMMGYKVANKVIKSRRTANYKEFEICIDEVEVHGSFIEVEKMTDGDIDVARKEVNEFLVSLGVPATSQVNKGYDIMAIEKQLKQ